MLNEYFVCYNVKRSSVQMWSFSNVSVVFMLNVVMLISDHCEELKPQGMHKLWDEGGAVSEEWKMFECGT